MTTPENAFNKETRIEPLELPRPSFKTGTYDLGLKPSQRSIKNHKFSSVRGCGWRLGWDGNDEWMRFYIQVV